MKKLVLLLILAFAFNQNEIKSQTIINPVGDELQSIDINGTNIVLVNITTGETYHFTTVAQLLANWSSLSEGLYNAEYSLNSARIKNKIKIKNKNNS